MAAENRKWLRCRKVGGILANNDFIQHLMENMQTRISNRYRIAIRVKSLYSWKLCIHPLAPQPCLKRSFIEILWNRLMNGMLFQNNRVKSSRKRSENDRLEPTPTNLYGTHDNFDLTPLLMFYLWWPKVSRKNGNTVTLQLERPCENFFCRYMAHCSTALENTLPDYLYNVGTGEDLIKQWLKPYKDNRTPRRNYLG
jgi:GDP-L-fucose synthase